MGEERLARSVKFQGCKPRLTGSPHSCLGLSGRWREGGESFRKHSPPQPAAELLFAVNLGMEDKGLFFGFGFGFLLCFNFRNSVTTLTMKTMTLTCVSLLSWLTYSRSKAIRSGFHQRDGWPDLPALTGCQTRPLLLPSGPCRCRPQRSSLGLCAPRLRTHRNKGASTSKLPRPAQHTAGLHHAHWLCTHAHTHTLIHTRARTHAHTHRSFSVQWLPPAPRGR